VLLLHGLCGAPTMRFVANGLARAGYTVHCLQLAGHCGTEEDINNTTWQDWYASAEAALIEIRKECDIVIVGGLSTGAVLSLLLAAMPCGCRSGNPIKLAMRLLKTIRKRRACQGMSQPLSHRVGANKAVPCTMSGWLSREQSAKTEGCCTVATAASGSRRRSRSVIAAARWRGALDPVISPP
jgi:hypothetical protein